MAGIVLSHDFGTKFIDEKVEGCWLCEVTKQSWCVACEEIAAVVKVL